MLIREVGSIIDAVKLVSTDNQTLPDFGSIHLDDDKQFNDIENEVMNRNETFAMNNEAGVVIDSPSNDYLVHPAVIMSQRRSLKETPKFQEEEVEDEFVDC